MKKKVVLVYATGPVDRSMLQMDVVGQFPSGIHYLYASLETNGISTGVYGSVDNPDGGYILDRILMWDPDVVGFSTFSFNDDFVARLAMSLKVVRQGIRIVLGGPQATSIHKEIMDEAPYIDAVLRGECEKSLVELVQSEFITERLAKVRGLTWRDADTGKVMVNEDAPAIEDLDSLPTPALHGSKYNHLTTSRGCPGNCKFCAAPLMSGKTVRYRGADKVIEEMQSIMRHGVSFFKVMDDTFCTDRGRVRELCQKIQDRKMKITWEVMSRVDLADQETLNAMSSAGCKYISYGVESGSLRLRKYANKGISMHQITNAYRMSRKAGMKTGMFLIHFGDMESLWTVLQNMWVILRCRPTKVFLCALTLYPGTFLFQSATDGGIISGKSWRVGPQFYPVGKMYLARIISWFIRSYNYLSCGSKEKILS